MYNNLSVNYLTKIALLTICTFLVGFVKSQTVWVDVFSDSNFTNNPTWNGDTSCFIVNSNYELQLSAPAVSSSKRISTPSKAIIKASWEFKIHYDFNPSSNNYSTVYFASDALLNYAYAVKIGGTSSDNISFLKIENGFTSTLINSSDDWLDLNQIDIKIKITRDSLNTFKLYADTSSVYQFIGAVKDSSIYTSSHFTWECNYTSTRSTKFYIDNISVDGELFSDNIKPKVTTAELSDSNSILLGFSEPIDSNSIINFNNYVLSPNGVNPTSVEFHSNSNRKLILNFKDNFTNNTNYNLWIEKIHDLSDNVMKDSVLHFFYYLPSFGDVVFSEVMFDPSPPVSLPETEFIEIYNNTPNNINLGGWKIDIGSKSIELPEYYLKPKSYLLLADSNEIDLFSTPNKVGVYFPTGTLINSGAILEMFSEQNTLINYLKYSSEMFSNPNKADGGWSLENTQVKSPCWNSKYWDGSEKFSGGTPGEINSIIDSSVYENAHFKYVVFKNKNSIELQFSSSINNLKIESGLPIFSITEVNNLGSIYKVVFASEMAEKQIYNLKFFFNDYCSGNEVSQSNIKFGVPESATLKDVLLNEILFNPSEENTDFIEIYNSSDYCISLNNLRLAQVNNVDGNPENIETITADSILLPPSEYWVLTENTSLTSSYYSISNSYLLFQTSIPSMPNDKGSIGICNASLQWIDNLTYDDNWHHELISNDKNVSLERVHLQSETQQSTNWHSASFSVNYATPTRSNSQKGNYNNTGTVTLSTNIVTPDNNGLDDFVSINFSLNKPGWVATIILYDGFGRKIKPLLLNKTLATNEVIVWDGLGKNQSLIRRGPYIIFIEIWHPDGEKLKFKKPITVYYE